MKTYCITFTRTQECTVSIKAKNQEDAEERFSNGKYNENDVEIHSTDEEFDDCEEEEE